MQIFVTAVMITWIFRIWTTLTCSWFKSLSNISAWSSGINFSYLITSISKLKVTVPPNNYGWGATNFVFASPLTHLSNFLRHKWMNLLQWGLHFGPTQWNVLWHFISCQCDMHTLVHWRFISSKHTSWLKKKVLFGIYFLLLFCSHTNLLYWVVDSYLLWGFPDHPSTLRASLF